MMPYPCGADQVSVFSQGSEGKFRFLCWHKPATLTNHGTEAIEKKWRALHDATPEHDSVGSKQVDQVGKA
jgi:hypothetical protein